MRRKQNKAHKKGEVRKIMLKRAVIAVAVVLFNFSLCYAEIKLKIVVANPSTTEAQVAPVKFDLPKGIEPEDIIDIGDMELKYDFQGGTYNVSQKVPLQPSEKKVLEVRLRDIWNIPTAELSSLKKHNDALIDKLKDSKHNQTGRELYKKINGSLQEISDRQGEAGLLTKDRINLYYENLKVLDGIKKDMGMLENLVLDIGGVVEERVEVPDTMAVSVSAGGEDGSAGTVDLNIAVSNPSSRTKELAAVRYALPREVTPKYIVENDGLDIEYDFKKECFYLYKDAVELQPGETKSYTVRIKDIWKIPAVEIDALHSHTRNLMLLLEGTALHSQAEPIGEKIEVNLKSIEKTQGMKVPAGEHIAYFRSNMDTLLETKQYVAQLEKMVTQSGATPGVTIAKAERLKGGGPEVEREKGYEGVSILAESIFRSKAPTVATTWRVIFIILGFVGVVGMFFFILWYIQIKKRQKPQ